MAICRKGVKTLNQVDILAFIIQLLGSYIFVTVATSNAQKQTIIDSKIDLRNTKEDLMAEIKTSRQSLLREQQAASMALKDVITATIKAEIEQATKEKNK